MNYITRDNPLFIELERQLDRLSVGLIFCSSHISNKVGVNHHNSNIWIYVNDSLLDELNQVEANEYSEAKVWKEILPRYANPQE
jgi:hypothetical protein